MTPAGRATTGAFQTGFGAGETHQLLGRLGARVTASSEGLGWTSAYASVQRERPFEACFHALSDSLMVLHRGGPVDVTFTMGTRRVARTVPKGGIFFLPPGAECNVNLHAALDTTHIYLRSALFAAKSGRPRPACALAPVFGERDPILEHLAAAIGDAIDEMMPTSALYVDPIAAALARRFLARHDGGVSEPPRCAPLGERQRRRLDAFLDSHLDGDIRLDAMAAVCGLSSDYFLRQFKATVGLSPYQHVIALRVERAKRLLGNARYSLAEIAAQCGFAHQEHMTRLFRRAVGTSPGRWRRERIGR